MTTTKRTKVAIKKDYKAVLGYVKENPNVSSFKEIAYELGLSQGQVRTSLLGHPIVFNRIKKQTAENQRKQKEALAKKKAEEAALAKKKAEEEALAKKKAEEAALAKKQAEEEALAKKKAEEAALAKKKAEEVALVNVKFVIDASITGIEGIQEILKNICAEKGKIILTSITIKELDKMQKYNDVDGRDARKILSMAAGNENFECTLINENIGIPDDCIIQYCAEHKDNVILFTADKTMELKARAYGVKTRYFKQNKCALNSASSTMEYSNTKKHSLYATRKYGEHLYLNQFNNEVRTIVVMSKGVKKNSDNVCELKIGDDVYIATKKENYLTFAHYKMISLAMEDNCALIYHTRVYDLSEIDKLPKADYKAFMRNFKRKVNF